MQFHMMAAFLLLIVFRWPILGCLVGFAIVIAGCILTALHVMWYNFPMPAPGIVRDIDFFNEYNGSLYFKPFAHIAVYIIGMCVGYIVLKYGKHKMSNMLLFIGWIIAIICSLATVYGLYSPTESKEVTAVYISLHRMGWAVGLSWLTYVCASGSGGIVNRILSWPVFIPLGQLSYLAYLLHPLVIIYRDASLRERVYYGHSEIVFQFFSNLLVSFFLAYIGYITVELPFTVLESVIFPKKARKKSEIDWQKRQSLSPKDIIKDEISTIKIPKDDP